MGLYIENDNMDGWLEENARVVDFEVWNDIGHLIGEVRLVAVSQPSHCAVLICWTESEVMRALPRDDDPRPCCYYFAKSEAVIENLGPSMVSAMKQDLAQGLTRCDLLFSSIKD